MVPGPGLPPGLSVDRSNNNLDVAIGPDGDLWLATRTAPTHYASERARLLVLRSGDDGVTWSIDHVVAPGRDVREPRLVAWRGRLLLYWFTAGTRGTRFEPDRIWVSEHVDGSWSEPLAISPPDCVVWRVRPAAGRLLMSLYRGGASLYTSTPVPLTVELWASDDGLTWAPADPERPVVHHGGAEAEILELPDGRLLAVVRKEGPEGGWGSDVAVAEPGARSVWRLAHDPRKFDSPHLVLCDGVPYLIARRQVAFGGRYDLGLRWLPDGVRTKLNMALYALTPKRTALYRIDPDRLAATWVGDLPSAGDTAFAAALEVPGGLRVWNYSSPVRRGWWPWMVGQLRPTHIYEVTVTDLG